MTDSPLSQRRLGRSNLTVTDLSFGGAAIGNLFTEVDDATAAATIDAAWDGGIRLFDTAPHYGLGLSERRAAAVIAYLATRGVDEDELQGRGFGKTKPRVSDPFSPENRRVETHLLEQP